MLPRRTAMLLSFLQVLTTILVAIAMALSLAHALEFPGKARLSKDTYRAVQPIYYPGFTIGGAVGDMGGTLATVILVLITPLGTVAFWLTLTALLGLLGMQAVYWIVTHPVNKFWLRDESLGGFGSGFFSLGKAKKGNAKESWTQLRDRWEYSHVARAALAMMSLTALVTAIAVS
jgi:hypothetical protein